MKHALTITQKQEQAAPELVAADVIARRMSVTGRCVLKWADENKIPCVRLGKKCVRFFPNDVAAALGFQWKPTA